MYLITFLQGMVFYSSVSTLYRQAVGITIFQITLIESISFALQILFELPWGIIADRIGYRTTMVCCSILYFISKIIFWQADSFGLFLLERVILAVVCAGLSGVDSTIIYLSCSQKEAQKCFGICSALGTAGMIFSSVCYALRIGPDYRLAAFATMLSYGAACLCSFLLTDVQDSSNPGEKRLFLISDFFRTAKNTLCIRGILPLLISCAFLNQTHQTIVIYLNQLQYQKAGMSSQLMSVVYILVTLCSLISAFSATLTKKIGDRLTGFALLSVSAAACILLAGTSLAVPSVIGILTLAVTYSLFTPLMTRIQNECITVRDRATALSVQAILIDLICIVLNLVFGWIAEWALSAAMLFGFLLCFAAAILYLSAMHSLRS